MPWIHGLGLPHVPERRNEDCDVHKHQDTYGALFVPGQMARLILSSFLVICTLSKLGTAQELSEV